MAFRRKKAKDESLAESGNSIKSDNRSPSAAAEFIQKATERLSYAAAVLYKNFLIVSAYSGQAVKTFLKRFIRFTISASKKVWSVIEIPARKMGIRFYKVFKRTADVITEPYHSFKEYFKVIKRRLREAEEIEQLTAPKVIAKTIKEGAKRNKSLIFKTVLNYAMPVICIAALYGVVHLTSTLTFAVEVKFNDKAIGTVSGEYVYTDAHNMLMQQIVYDKNENSDQIPTNAQLTLKLSSKDQLVDSDTLVGRMVQSSGQDIVESVGVYVNDRLIGSVKSSEPIKTALNNILLKHRRKNSTAITFADKIQLKSGIYLTETLRSENGVIKTLKGNKIKQRAYKLKKGDTPIEVADRFNLKVRDIYSLNPGLKNRFRAGRKIKVTAKVPFLSVKETRREKYSKTLYYETKYVSDSSHLKGYTETVRSGKNGRAVITADVTYVNGVETGRKVISKKVTKQPVDKKVARGTKTISSTYSAGPSARISGSSQFIWPVNGGYTSSHYGYRGGEYHKGTDIAAPAGTSVYAAASGRVTLATWYSGYGECVIIDHGNGISTLYGHNSAIFVHAGQYVSQGQNIAAVGQTGWASGNHSHFEVRVGGSCVNPETYIGSR